MYNIEHDKTPPESRSKKGFPFADMYPGDYFDVPFEDAKSARSAASNYGKLHKRVFTTRTMEGFVRVWRVK